MVKCLAIQHMLAQQPPACWGSEDLCDKDTPTASPMVIGTGQPAPSPALGAHSTGKTQLYKNTD